MQNSRDALETARGEDEMNKGLGNPISPSFDPNEENPRD